MLLRQASNCCNGCNNYIFHTCSSRLQPDTNTTRTWHSNSPLIALVTMLFTANPLHRLMTHSPARIASLLQLCSLRGPPTAPSNQQITHLAACFTSLHVTAPSRCTMPPSALSLAPQPHLPHLPPSLPSHVRRFLTLPGMDAELSKKHRERRLVG